MRGEEGGKGVSCELKGEGEVAIFFVGDSMRTSIIFRFFGVNCDALIGVSGLAVTLFKRRSGLDWAASGEEGSGGLLKIVCRGCGLGFGSSFTLSLRNLLKNDFDSLGLYCCIGFLSSRCLG